MEYKWTQMKVKIGFTTFPFLILRWFYGLRSLALEVRTKVHEKIFTRGLLEKSNLVQHAYEDHKICWKGAKVLQVEQNITYRKEQTTWFWQILSGKLAWIDISPIWTLIIGSRSQ
jgi:hypothetical protein